MPGTLPAVGWQRVPASARISGITIVRTHAHEHSLYPKVPLRFHQVIGEMRAGLADWESQKRWDTLGISAQVGGSRGNRGDKTVGST